MPNFKQLISRPEFAENEVFVIASRESNVNKPPNIVFLV